MAYAAVEGYERMLTGMRRYRDMKTKGEDTRFVELEIAYAMGWTGHYTGDGAQPLHDTVHHDGWQGDNPKGYTTNPRVHGLFETQFVDAMKLEGGDFQPKVGAARVLADPFAAILAHLDEAGSHTEQVYQLEKSGALADPANAEARALVIQQTARGAALLRDLAHTAWVQQRRAARRRSRRQSDRAGASALQPADGHRAGARHRAAGPVGQEQEGGVCR